MSNLVKVKDPKKKHGFVLQHTWSDGVSLTIRILTKAGD